MGLISTAVFQAELRTFRDKKCRLSSGQMSFLSPNPALKETQSTDAEHVKPIIALHPSLIHQPISDGSHNTPIMPVLLSRHQTFWQTSTPHASAQKNTETTKSLKICYLFNISRIHFETVHQ